MPLGEPLNVEQLSLVWLLTPLSCCYCECGRFNTGIFLFLLTPRVLQWSFVRSFSGILQVGECSDTAGCLSFREKRR